MNVKNEIIINGIKLGPVKSWIFKKSSSQLYQLVKKIYLSAVMLIATLTAIMAIAGYVHLLLIGVFLAALLIILHSKILDERFYIRRQDIESDIGNSKEEFIKKSYYITYDNFGEILSQPWYDQGDIEIDILKNSSGHRIIEELQQKAAKDVAVMVPYAKNITTNMINNVLKHYHKTNEEIKIDSSKMNPQDKSIDRLKEMYAIANGVSLDSKFNKKAIDMKTKVELINFIEQRFVKESVQ